LVGDTISAAFHPHASTASVESRTLYFLQRLEGVRTVAKPNYAFAKRQRDLAKKQKKEAKRQRKAEPEQPPATGTAQTEPLDEKTAS
jgi:hypothetical protein